MKKKISVLLAILMIVLSGQNVFAVQSKNEYVADENLISSNVTIPADIVNSIFEENGNRKAKVYSQKDAMKADELETQLSCMYITLDKLRSNNPDGKNDNLIEKIEFNIENIKKQLVDLGAIILSENQAKAMFVNNENSKNANMTCPTDTTNTEYNMYGPYTVTDDYGDIGTYYYVTAVCKTTNSRMYDNDILEMNVDMIKNYANAVVKVYVNRFVDDIAGKIISKLPTFFQFLPWELYSEIPETRHNLTSNYNIDVAYTTNVKFIWFYSEPFDEYYLATVLNSTTTREEHNYNYVYNGSPQQDEYVKQYTVSCEHYFYVRDIAEEFWNSSGTLIVEGIDSFEYYYNGTLEYTIKPPKAQGMFSMN